MTTPAPRFRYEEDVRDEHSYGWNIIDTHNVHPVHFKRGVQFAHTSHEERADMIVAALNHLTHHRSSNG